MIICKHPLPREPRRHFSSLQAPPENGHPLLKAHQPAAFGEDESRVQQDTLLVT